MKRRKEEEEEEEIYLWWKASNSYLCDDVCLQWTLRAVAPQFSANVCTCLRTGYPLLLHVTRRCFLWSEDTKFRHVFLRCEQCSFSLNCGQIYAFIWCQETVRIIYCNVCTVDGTFSVSKYLLSLWSIQFRMQRLLHYFKQFSFKNTSTCSSPHRQGSHIHTRYCAQSHGQCYGTTLSRSKY